MAKAKATSSKKATDSGKKSDTRRKTDAQKKSDNVKAVPKRPPANGKKRPAGPTESVPPVGTAQRINKRKPLLTDVDPDAPSSGKEEEEQPPKKKKRSASPAQKQKEAEKKKQRKKKSTEDKWVDKQDPAPEEEENSEIPKKNTLEWHRWNLRKSFLQFP